MQFILFISSVIYRIVPCREMNPVSVESPSLPLSLAPFCVKEKAVLGVMLGSIVVRGDVCVDDVNI